MSRIVFLSLAFIFFLHSICIGAACAAPLHFKLPESVVITQGQSGSQFPAFALSVSSIERIQSVTFLLEAPFQITELQPGGKQGEFTVEFSQTGLSIAIQAKRTGSIRSFGQQPLAVFTQSTLSDPDIGFGTIRFASIELGTQNTHDQDITLQNGSWFYQTDFNSTLLVQTISALGEPIEGAEVNLVGTAESPTLFGEQYGPGLGKTDAKGFVRVLYPPDSSLLYQDDQMNSPKTIKIDLVFSIIPPVGSAIPAATKTVSVKPQAASSIDDIFPTIQIELSPASGVKDWEQLK